MIMIGLNKITLELKIQRKISKKKCIFVTVQLISAVILPPKVEKPISHHEDFN